MTTRTRFYIHCDACGSGDGLSRTEAAARAEVRCYGWVQVRDQRGELVDLCPDCAARLEEWAGAPRLEVQEKCEDKED